MDNAFETLKRIVLIVFISYFIIFLIKTDFLLNLTQVKFKFDVGYYFLKILNIK